MVLDNKIILILSVRNLLIASLSALCVIACGNDHIVYSYVVVESVVEDSATKEWRPVMRVTYQVGENEVISEVAGLLDKYEGCSIKDKNNWQCNYEDGTGKNIFGFNDGRYWKAPSLGEDVRHVSRWEYNVIRCKLFQHDSGRFKGIASCLQTYI